jgi:hypothetical protein
MARRTVWALVLSLAMVGAVGSTASAATTFVVDDDGMAAVGDCNASTPTYSVISDAVAAAAAGDTIWVCPGNYSGSQVVVDKTLWILGAQHGATATGCDERAGGESKVFMSDGVGNTGAFWIQADNVRIDGFLIENNFGPGVQLNNDHSGSVIINNIIRNNVMGVYLNASPSGPAARTKVSQNCIADNNVSGPANGNGIYSDAGLRHAEIFDNTFVHHANSGILLIKDSIVVKNVLITSNRSIDDKTFVTLYGARGVTIQLNSLWNEDESFNDAGSAIYIGGGSDIGFIGSESVLVYRNKIRTNHFAGVAVRGSSDDVVVKKNDIKGTTRGIDVSTDAVGGAQVLTNRVRRSSEFGIYFRSWTSENTASSNNVKFSGAYDCQDDSVGSGTSGTANQWAGTNRGFTSNPAGLCTAP